MMQDEWLRFDHLLARDLGWQSVDRLRREMTTAEYLEHAAYYRAREALKKGHGG
jgi:hypothetical protein